MDFLKFFDICESSQLYFSSIKGLRDQDPFEGSYSKFHTEYQLVKTAVGPGPHEEWKMERHIAPKDLNPLRWQMLQEIDAYRRRTMPNYVYANCWHINPNENLAIWKMYDLSGYGIVIVSNVERLQESFIESNKIMQFGEVKYIDYLQEKNLWEICLIHSCINIRCSLTKKSLGLYLVQKSYF